MDPFQHHPFGTRIPNTLHAVCSSLPTIADVVAYEEKHPHSRNALTSGYPRFVEHFYVRQLAEYLKKEKGLDGQIVFPLASNRYLDPLQIFLDRPLKAIEGEGFCAVHLPEQDRSTCQKIQAFIQHVGGRISSRQAEDLLLKKGLIAEPQTEAFYNGDAKSIILHKLRSIFKVESSEDILLCNSGMNAFYATFQTVNAIQKPRGKNLWLQLGWIYTDTYKILRELNPNKTTPIEVLDIFDRQNLEKVFTEQGQQIAGIICEVPTNPLIQTCDLTQLQELAQKHGAVLVIDPTISSPQNIEVLPYADVVVNSLTKYASSQGDVMAGTIVLNQLSRFYSELKTNVKEYSQPLYIRDTQRLALEIEDYESVVNATNTNTLKLVEFLEGRPSIRKVYWAYEERSRANYEALARGTAMPGACLTIELNTSFVDFYDTARVVKGPSFGTIFTMMCPYMYLAHYNLAGNLEGRESLRKKGLDPELVRISVGIEDSDSLINVFSEVL